MIDLHQDVLTSREDLRALETALRLSTAERYAALAHAVEDSEVADLLRALAEQDPRHTSDDDPQDAAVSGWRAYLSDADEGDQDTTLPVQPTAYQVLAFAVQQETLTFRRLTYAAAQTAQPDLADRAEALAQACLARAAALRPARRKAYRAERAAAPDHPFPLTQEALRDTALRRERDLLRLIDRNAAVAPSIAPVRAITVDLITQLSDGEVAGKIPSTEPIQGSSGSDRTALTTALDRSFALYDRAVSQSRDVEMQALAQALSAATVARLVTLASTPEP